MKRKIEPPIITLTLSLLMLHPMLYSLDAYTQTFENKNILTLPELYTKTKNSIVEVVSVENATLNDTVNAGFVYDKQGHIVTSLSAVPDNDLIITFLNGTDYNATFIGSDPFSDLAVLSVDNISQDKLVPLPLGNSTKLDIGEQVAAIGSPFGLTGVLTEGVIGKLGATIPAEEEALDNGETELDNSSFSIPDIVVTDVPINPGNSGGPLLNMEGEVIGINLAVFSSTGEYAGISFTLPSNTIKKIVPSLITNRSYAHPSLGIVGIDVTPQIANTLGIKESRGFLVTDLTPGGPSERAGIRVGNISVDVQGREVMRGGDMIVGINGHPVRTIDDILTYLVREKDVGDNVNLKVLGSDGQINDVNVILEARPTLQ
jgi:S1-C subfamily serine protease